MLLCLLMFSGSALAQADKAQNDLFKREAVSLRAVVDDAASSVVPGAGVLQSAKATYLEGYGIVISIEAALEPTRNPFSSSKTPADVRALVTQRRKDLQQKLENMLKERTGALQSIAPAESVSIVVYLFNSNPADLPNLPAQFVLTSKKQDPSRITVREFQ